MYIGLNSDIWFGRLNSTTAQVSSNFFAPGTVTAAGFVSTATNYVVATTPFAGTTNNNSYTEEVNIYGTSGNIIKYFRTGASGVSAFTPIWTNTIIASGQSYILGTNCAIQITSGVNVVGTISANP